MKPTSLPTLTISLLTLVTAIYALAPDPSVLYFAPTEIAGGQAWRLLTGHLVHADLNHLFWNALGLLVLGVSDRTAFAQIARHCPASRNVRSQPAPAGFRPGLLLRPLRGTEHPAGGRPVAGMAIDAFLVGGSGSGWLPHQSRHRNQHGRFPHLAHQLAPIRLVAPGGDDWGIDSAAAEQNSYAVQGGIRFLIICIFYMYNNHGTRREREKYAKGIRSI